MRTLTILTTSLIAAIILIFSSCNKDEDYSIKPREEVYQGPKIYCSLNGDLKSQGELKNEILDGTSFNVYGEEPGKNITFLTDPLTDINWQITGPDLDTIIMSRSAIMFKLSSYGTYNVRAYNDPPYGFEFNATINMVEDGIPIITDGRPIGSVWDESDGVFYYTFRIEKPAIITSADTLFRITEISGDASLPFNPIFDGVNITPGGDSIDITFPYQPTGINSQGIKFTAGYMRNGEEIWFTPNSVSVYKCQDGTLNDIFEIITYNGNVGVIGTTSFDPPADAIEDLGDWSKEIPVIIMGIDHSADQVNLYIMSESATAFRYKDEMVDDWIYVPITNLTSSIRGFVTLPKGPPSGEWIFQFGTGLNDASFIIDPYVELSEMFYGPYNSLQFLIGQ